MLDFCDGGFMCKHKQRGLWHPVLYATAEQIKRCTWRAAPTKTGKPWIWSQNMHQLHLESLLMFGKSQHFIFVRFWCTCVKCLFEINTFLVLLFMYVFLWYGHNNIGQTRCFACFCTGANCQHLSLGDNLLLISLEQRNASLQHFGPLVPVFIFTTFKAASAVPEVS